MSLFLVTAPTKEPVSLADAKTHLRVDVDDENDLIASLIVAAREYVETFTHRALVTQTWDLKLDQFPCRGEAIWLPKPPASSVTSITYTATDGTSTTWSSALYTTDLPTGPTARMGRITPAYGEYLPLDPVRAECRGRAVRGGLRRDRGRRGDERAGADEGGPQDSSRHVVRAAGGDQRRESRDADPDDRRAVVAVQGVLKE